MLLERIAFEVRPRSHWEAIDLGFALTRTHAAAVWRAWFAVSLPWFLLCNAAAWLLGAMWAGMLFLWWTKPLLDRVVLHVLSRAVFGATPTLGATLRELGPTLLRALPGALTVERLDLARSFDLPVSQLEGQRWLARLRRQRVLQSGARGAAVWLTVLCSNVEAAIGFGLWTGVLLFVPFEFLPETAKALFAILVDNDAPWATFVVNTVSYAAICVVEPFYVGGGFGIYLNRRTQLESWDVEISFRRLAARLEARAAGAAAAFIASALTAAFVLALAGAALGSPAAAAGEPPRAVANRSGDEDAARRATPDAVARNAFRLPPTVAIDEADAEDGELGRVLEAPPDEAAREERLRQALDAVYAADPNLRSDEGGGHWQYKVLPGKIEERETPAWLENLLLLLAALFAGLTRYALWLALIALLLIAWFTRRSWLPLVRDLAGPPPPRAVVVARAGAEGDSLPADVVAAAREAWAAGDARRALSLLYRDAVRRLARRAAAGLPRGATEAQCLRVARALEEPERGRFTLLVRAWQQIAYAHRAPSAAEFEALLPEPRR